jgi:hypothetical protein
MFITGSVAKWVAGFIERTERPPLFTPDLANLLLVHFAALGVPDCVNVASGINLGDDRSVVLGFDLDQVLVHELM